MFLVNRKSQAFTFHLPRSSGSPTTKDLYEDSFLFRGRLFHHSDFQALEKAYELTEALRKADFTVPVIDSEGNPTGERLTISEVDAELIEDQVARLNFRVTKKKTLKEVN